MKHAAAHNGKRRSAIRARADPVATDDALSGPALQPLTRSGVRLEVAVS